ncbi:MAG: DUF309 domain-containing protein [Terriglobales bacterium]
MQVDRVTQIGGGSSALIMTLSNESFGLGLDLFNRGQYFEAHEALEDVWRALPRDSPSRRRFRLHLQGLIQLAVAFHHYSTGNLVGARSVLARALRNLRGAERSFPDLDFEKLRAELVDWQRHLSGADLRPQSVHISFKVRASS